VLLLVAGLAGCGGDDEGQEPVKDAEVGDSGGSDAGAANDAGDAQVAFDAGGDAGAADAGDAGDAGSDAGDAATDAGSELAAALVTTGIRTDRRRAELVAPAFCQVFTGCGGISPPTQADCVTATLSDYDLLVAEGDSPNCIDATLDSASCVAGSTCADVNTRCGQAFIDRDTRCAN